MEYEGYRSNKQAKERYAYSLGTKALADKSNDLENFYAFLEQKPNLGNDIYAPSQLIGKALITGIANITQKPEILEKTIKLINEQNPLDDGVPSIEKAISLALVEFPNDKALDKIITEGNTEELSNFIIIKKLIQEVGQALGIAALDKNNLLEALTPNSPRYDITQYLIEQSNKTKSPALREAINQVIAQEFSSILTIGSEEDIYNSIEKAIKANNLYLAGLIKDKNPDAMIPESFKIALQPKEPEINLTEEKNSSDKTQHSLISRAAHKAKKRTANIIGVKVESLKDKFVDNRSLAEKAEGAVHKALKEAGLSSRSIKDRKNYGRSPFERAAHRLAKKFKRTAFLIEDRANLITTQFKSTAQSVKDEINSLTDKLIPGALDQALNNISISGHEEAKIPKIYCPTINALNRDYFEHVIIFSQKHASESDRAKRNDLINKDLNIFLDGVVKKSQEKVAKRQKEDSSEGLHNILQRELKEENLNKVFGTNRSSARKHDLEVQAAAEIFRSNINSTIAVVDLELIPKIQTILESKAPVESMDEALKQLAEKSSFKTLVRIMEDKHNATFEVKDTFWKSFANICKSANLTELSDKFESLNRSSLLKQRELKQLAFQAEALNLYQQLGIVKDPYNLVEKLLSQNVSDNRTIEEIVSGAKHYVAKIFAKETPSIDPTKRIKIDSITKNPLLEEITKIHASNSTPQHNSETNKRYNNRRP
jgi:hypothetical protein